MQYFSSNLCCKDCEDEFAGIEGVEDPGDDVEVAGGGDVGLKAHVGELRLWCDVDCHVLPQSVILLLLETKWINRENIFGSDRSSSSANVCPSVCAAQTCLEQSSF